MSSVRKKSSLTMMKRNRKRRRTKRTGAKRRHIAGRAYDTGRGVWRRALAPEPKAARQGLESGHTLILYGLLDTLA